MHKADLLVKLAYYEIDHRKFHAPIARLLREANSNDFRFFDTLDGRLARSRYSAKVHFAWRDQQLCEVARIEPDGTLTEKVCPWFVSGTIRQPRPIRRRIRSNRFGETPLRAAIREMREETGLRVKRDDLIALDGGQARPTPLRESSVWVGLLSQEIQYHFLCDVSYLDERPWPDGLTITDVNGTQVITEWRERTTYYPPVYEGAHS